MSSPQSIQFIECDSHRAQAFHADHPKADGLEADQFRFKAHSLLVKVAHLLQHELRLPFWLSSGTLLGYYRQCDYIVYSGDVDIGMWAEDFTPKLIDVFSSNGLPLIHWFGRVNDSLELSFVSDQTIKLDVFFFYKTSDHYWNGGTQARTGFKFKYKFPPFTLCWTEFDNILVRIPCETQSYVEANYGKNWMVPVQHWDWKTSPSNVEPNGQWDASEWTETIQLIPMPNL